MSDAMNFDQLVALCQRTHEELCLRAARAVDAHLVVRNWLFGHYIAEFEQKGADRAEYGARLLGSLADRLKPLEIKGTSVTRLKLYRSFYRLFPMGPTLSDPSAPLLPKPLEKSPTASDLLPADGLQIRPTLSAELLKRFTLGWSHYVELLTIDSPDERRFYEIEAAANQWGVRELRRQIATSLYQRLALSRDKDEIRRLATEGQIVEKAADLIKNPLVLEFLGLQDRPHYSEDDLEAAIIDQLESFLLELGKGFLFEARQKRFTFDNDHFRAVPVSAPTVRPIPARGNAFGPGSKSIRALKGRSKNRFRPNAPAPRYAAPSGLHSLSSARPRALPWAGMACPLGAQETCEQITHDLEKEAQP